MKLTIASIFITYLFAALLSPFPYWKTYFLLLRTVLFNRSACLPTSAKWTQIKFLLKQVIYNPFWVLLWYLDELFFSGYRQIQVNPVFIVGQPRCGTTLLHRTLAADSQSFFAIRHIEWRYPYILVQKLLKLTGIEKKINRKNYWPENDIGRLAAKMHPNTLADWEEDGIFFEERFLHHFFIFLRFPYPHLVDSLEQFESLPNHVRQQMLDVHQKVIQKVAYIRGQPQACYLSKEVTSHAKIPDLIARYPTARFLIVVRPAVDYMSSLMGLMRTSTCAKTGVDAIAVPGWKEAFLKRMREDSFLLIRICREVIPPERQIPVAGNYLIEHILETVKMIFQSLDLHPDSAFIDALAILDRKQHERKKGYDYDAIELIGFEDFDQFVHCVEKDFFSLLPTVKNGNDSGLAKPSWSGDDAM